MHRKVSSPLTVTGRQAVHGIRIAIARVPANAVRGQIKDPPRRAEIQRAVTSCKDVM
jgi:hypothetical protein